MTPSTWNDTNQHWIPRFLLKGFGRRGRVSSVYELDKHTKAISAHKVSEVASRPHLVTEQDDSRLKKIEDAAAKAMSLVRKGTNIEKMRAGDVLDGFGALHALAKAMEPINPYIGVNAQGSRTTVVEAFVATVKETMEQNGKIIDERDFRKYVDGILNHEVLSLSVDSPFPHLMWRSHIHIAPDGEYFVIGDSPVITIRSADGLPLQRILPISSKRVVTFTYNLWRGRARILGGTDTLTKSSALSSDVVRSLNAHYFHRTNSQYIYGKNETILKQSALQPREWAIDESTSADYDFDLMLELLATPMLGTYQNVDIRGLIGHLPVSKFIAGTRRLRIKSPKNDPHAAFRPAARPRQQPSDRLPRHSAERAYDIAVDGHSQGLQFSQDYGRKVTTGKRPRGLP